MMGEVSLETSSKNIMIKDMINSENSRYQARRKHFGSGAAIGTKKTAGGLGGTVSPPAGLGQRPGGGPRGKAPGSSVNLGILKP